MKYKKTSVTILVLLIAFLALIAAYTGVFHGWGGNILEFTTVRGQTIEVLDAGIYRYNSNSLVAEGGVAWDAVTLFFAIPLLLISLTLFIKNSIRGKLLLAGTLSYFFYQYLSYSVGWAFNKFFLIYIAIFSISMITLVLTVLAIDIKKLPELATDKIPRKSISIFLITVGVFFALMWLKMIIPSITDNVIPDLKGQTTLVTQALDLGMVVPFCIISGALLWKRNAYGYLFSSIVIMKSVTMSLALISMTVVSSILTGSALNFAVLAAISVLAATGMFFALMLMKNIREVSDNHAGAKVSG